ncbi:glycosyl hydrolase [Fontisphaera persica]|uniref:glycosyl hydrolase n=1 Tax=Fontisphaera persica TaxID=2974023 RepID=UPI0024BF2F2A|nr:glycosyl hydrolase [Fontisphaera persica]WCJ60447.1 glycosyl hydrolase [Fontisphaera persica]
MKIPSQLWLLLLAILPGQMLHGATTSPALPSSASVKKLFGQPPREYASAPLWVWNDNLTEAQIRETMRDLAGQNVRQVFVHPRPGLMTPYLSPAWFRLWKIALQEARRLDMNVWIYDENSYPSGFAGGWVPELMPESRGRGLAFKEENTPPRWGDNTLAIFLMEGDKATDVSSRALRGEPLPPGKYLVATMQRARNSPWHGDRCYVDLLYPGVTEKFLEVTLEAYRRELGHEFGKRIPGSFTDEPELTPAGGLPWTEDLPKQFQQRWGYSLLANLASLHSPVGDWQRVRHNYYQTLLDLFIERWAKPYYEYCEKHGLEFTGHYWEHEWPNARMVPDNMAMAAWQQRPGIDILMNQYAENTHAQFGNVRSCREISSLANQLGRARTLVELYGAAGWELRFEDMKRIADWLQVLGVNTMDEHLSYITIRGARKRDHPQSFSYHEPWWSDYHVHATYMTRLSCALSQGRQINRILVLEPTTTAWMWQGTPQLSELGSSFFNLLMALERAQVEYDLGCEDVLRNHGRAENGQLVVGQARYDRVVLPRFTENLNRATVQLLGQYTSQGGVLYQLGEPPSRVDGQVSGGGVQALRGPGVKKVTAEEVPGLLRDFMAQKGFIIHRAPNDAGILFHHRRQLADGELLLLVNTSAESGSSGVIQSDTAQGVEAWNLFTGAVESYPCEREAQGIRIRYSLPPVGSLLLYLSPQPLPSPAPGAATPARVAAAGPVDVQRLELNVLTLDYVDISAGGETRSNVYYYAANQFAYQKNGMPRNPWDSAVQFKDELIRKTFPPESGFSVTYRFFITGAVPAELNFVLERPDLYTITCNGRPLTPQKGRWWMDKSFGVLDLRRVAQLGENVVTCTARPFRIEHEIEPAYVLGAFTLRPASRGFIIAPDEPIVIKPAGAEPVHGINPDTTMWLSGGVKFSPNVNDRQPWVVFDLGEAKSLAEIKIWNYCEGHVRDLTGRGAREIRLSAGLTSAQDTPLDWGRHTLAQAQGAARPQKIQLPNQPVRYLKIEILSNHHGVSYPCGDDVPDHGFVGLAEVRFIDKAGQAVKSVRVAAQSSELPAHQRLARYLVDGSSLQGAKPGWNEQGHPFYAGGVAYRQTFELSQTSGRYLVRLPDWLGSVARVKVNGKFAGHIYTPPYECEVTRQLKAGRNVIEVTVVGTLKNTLGPHHAGSGLGSAWPGMFQRGPAQGPPPGNQYFTVGYGLFAPFELEQRKP